MPKLGELEKEEEEKMKTSDLNRAAPAMYEFVARLASYECQELPSEYPEEGEDGKAPCLHCEARELLQKAGLLKAQGAR